MAQLRSGQGEAGPKAGSGHSPRQRGRGRGRGSSRLTPQRDPDEGEARTELSPVAGHPPPLPAFPVL